jgi:hypothetical protein
MFQEYQKTVLASMLATSAVVAQVLQALIPPGSAAALGVIAGLVFSMRMDLVNKQFKLHDQDQFQPSTFEAVTGFGAVIVGLLLAFWIAGFYAPAIAAPLGILAMLFVVLKTFF